MERTHTAPKASSQLKLTPFGAHFATKLEGINNKLVCALSCCTTCTDDIPPAANASF